MPHFKKNTEAREIAKLFDPSASEGPITHIFDEIQKRGNVDEVEMYRTFNMGIGLVVIVPARDVENSLRVLAVEKYAGVVIGEVVSADRSVIIQ